MTSKGLGILVLAAAGLGAGAYFAGRGGPAAPAIEGEKIVGNFAIDKVAKIDIGGKVVLEAGDDGWKISTMQGYPADRSKIAENLMKLQELKVGQVVRGKKLAEKTPVSVTAADGSTLASVVLGERHEKWNYGRYVEYKGQAVLTGESLDMFGTDSKRWCETKIVDDPWISFNTLAEPGLDDSVLGFATGVVAKVTIAGDTNRTITVGNKVGSGTDRYVKLDGSKWVYTVSSYSVDKFLPKDKPEEKKTEEKPAEETKVGAKPAEEVKSEPAKTEPAKVEPAKAEPVKVEPAKTEPAKVEPAKAEPVKVEPAKTEPAKEEKGA